MAIEKSIKKALDQFGTDLVTDLKDSLIKHGHGGSTNNSNSQSGLAGSIHFKLFGRDTQVLFSLYMEDYWYQLEHGRKKGKRPPADRFDEWQTAKGINALAIYKSKLKEPSKSKVNFQSAKKSLSFAIASSVAKKGTIKRFGYRGSKFYSSVIKDGRIKQLSSNLEKLLVREVKIELVELL